MGHFQELATWEGWEPVTCVDQVWLGAHKVSLCRVGKHRCPNKSGAVLVVHGAVAGCISSLL